MSDSPGEAILALEDGRTFRGRSFGAPGECCGELVFNTSLCGYQEILTDPSYAGQIVTMTYPHIGNYGVNRHDVESRRIQAVALVVREACSVPSNWQSEMTLPEYLRQNGIVGLDGVDTRAITRHIREAGAMKAAISTLGRSEKEVVEMARNWPGLVGRDMVQYVTRSEPETWPSPENPRFRVVVYDFGVKNSILRFLADSGCQITVVPAYTPAEDVLAQKPDGVLLSNGPGDPAGLTRIIPEVRKLIGQVPLFGICLGVQVLALALGGKTFKLKFGHRGGNHPVQDLTTGRIEITSQNHGFCVDIESLPKDELEITHLNLIDRTLEGFRHRRLPIFAVQFHPEGGPGPYDATHLFQRFASMMTQGTPA